MKNSFGGNLRVLRTERKMSQAALAKAVGVTQQAVSGWESGSMEPTLSNLWALADVFDISVDELIGRRDF